MVKASIIIPVYNAENTIEYCLDSILKQTYKNIEVILINDESKDSSLEILNKYKNKYPHIFKVYNQKNTGAAIARNKGLEYSKGEYVFFIDNDDYIDPEYVETFVKRIEETKTEMVIGGYKRVDIENNKIMFKRDATDNPWTKYMFLAPWARIYKRSALINNNLGFINLNIGEDVYLNMICNLKLKIATLNYTGYNWVYNRSSMHNTKHKGLNKDVEFIPMLEKIFTDIKGIKTDENEYIEYFFIKTCLYYILHSGRGTEYTLLKTESSKIFNWLKDKYPNYQSNKYIGIFKPRGEILTVKVIIFIYIILQKLRLENLFLKIYSRI